MAYENFIQASSNLPGNLLIAQRFNRIQLACFNSGIQSCTQANKRAYNNAVHYPVPGNYKSCFEYHGSQVSKPDSQQDSKKSAQETDNNRLKQKLATNHFFLPA